MKTFFCADLHFSCKNLMCAIRKEFTCIEDHDQAILDGINRTVSRIDRLVICGDFCHKKPGRWRPKIRCRNIVFVRGNHDQTQKIKAVFGGQTYEQKMIKGEFGDKFFLCHYPMAYWPESHYCSIHLFGHLHDDQEKEERMDLAFPGRRALDVGIDAARRILGEWRPFSEEEILYLLKDRQGHEELWRDIPGYEGTYQASYLGRVKSAEGIILNPKWQMVTLCKEGKATDFLVHRLIALTWLGKCPEGKEVSHGHKGNENNSVKNLWYTPIVLPRVL